MNRLNQLLGVAARSDHAGVVVTRVGLVVVLVWIGSLKAFRYEDEGIAPFVANTVLSHIFQAPEWSFSAIFCDSA